MRHKKNWIGIHIIHLSVLPLKLARTFTSRSLRPMACSGQLSVFVPLLITKKGEIGDSKILVWRIFNQFSDWIKWNRQGAPQSNPTTKYHRVKYAKSDSWLQNFSVFVVFVRYAKCDIKFKVWYHWDETFCCPFDENCTLYNRHDSIFVSRKWVIIYKVYFMPCQ